MRLSLDIHRWPASDRRHVRMEDDAVRVDLKKGGFAGASGVNHKMDVPEVFPAHHVLLTYKVYVPKDFDSVKGGKLVGITINGGCGGRDWEKDKGSIRIMFRRDNQLVCYLYLPTNQGSYNGTEHCPLMKQQGPEFRKNCHHTNGAGLDIFRSLPKPKQMRLENGRWNSVELEIKLNDKGRANGLLRMKVNDTEHALRDVSYTADPAKTPLRQFQFSTWFGGGDTSYAPNKDTYIMYKDVDLEKKS